MGSRRPDSGTTQIGSVGARDLVDEAAAVLRRSPAIRRSPALRQLPGAVADVDARRDRRVTAEVAGTLPRVLPSVRDGCGTSANGVLR